MPVAQGGMALHRHIMVRARRLRAMSESTRLTMWQPWFALWLSPWGWRLGLSPLSATQQKTPRFSKG